MYQQKTWRILLWLFACCSSLVWAKPLDMDLMEGIKPRAIGPAGTSGRVTSIDVVKNDINVIYIGTASGGVWKSTNQGMTWKNQFNEEEIANVGSLAIDPNHPDVIWVGTGEGNPRNSHNSGYGIYKSLDGGETWEHLGLEQTRNIHKVIVDPQDSNTVYVGAIGSAWGDSKHRGVYKTTDGGKNWEQILYVNEQTGVADMILDPNNSKKLFVAMWQYRRWPWFFKSGGEGSGLYVTYNSGEDFTQLTEKEGLPEGELGRIGLAIGTDDSSRVYALIESKNNGLYSSNDGGKKWQRTAEKGPAGPLGGRPFYYSDIFVDPQNKNRIYNLASTMSMSIDGGKTFSPITTYSGPIHPDNHAFWINPNNPKHLINGNDGGLGISYDQGKNWRFVSNIPASQFYHINIDNALPYNVYGGMQDNGSWVGPSRVFREDGLINDYWDSVSFGDGFDVIPDRDNQRFGYSLFQRGHLIRWDRELNDAKLVQPVHPDGEYLRFNWNAGIATDPFDNKTVYIGSQYLHKSTDRGISWSIISPDLTTNDPEKQKQSESGGLTYDVTGAEGFTSILTVAPSTVKAGVIWVGTDDGRVHVTEDDGKNWRSVEKKLKGLPKGSWIAQIKASEYDAGAAFLVANNYRRDDWTPYVYHTTNYGKSWKRLADEDDVFGYALAIQQDPVVSDLLFLGTEGGLYFSLNQGKAWQKWTKNYPTVSTMDLAFQKREKDLVLGTYGRSIFILDDIEFLRELAQKGPELFTQPIHLFQPRPAYGAPVGRKTGDIMLDSASFSGDNLEYGALLTFSVNPEKLAVKTEETDKKETDKQDKPADSAKVEILIYDSKNQLIRTLKTEAKAGINRVTWDLGQKGLKNLDAKDLTKEDKEKSDIEGWPASGGKYKVVVKSGEHESSKNLKVVYIRGPDPRDLQSWFTQVDNVKQAAIDAVAWVKTAKERVQQLSALTTVNTHLTTEQQTAMTTLHKDMQKSLTALVEKVLPPEDVQGYYTNPELLQYKINRLEFHIGFGKLPIQTQAQPLYDRVKVAVNEYLKEVNSFQQQQWQEYQQQVEAQGVGLFQKTQPIQLQ